MTSSHAMGARICVLDDEKDTGEMLEAMLEQMGHHVDAFTDAQAALAHAATSDVDIFLTDLSMAGMSGLDVCERVIGTRPGTPVIVITGVGTMETAIGAIRAGAFDFLTKPVDRKLLGLAIDRALQHRHLSEEARRLRQAVSTTNRPSSIIGNSGPMQKLFDLVSRVAPSEASVLIHGETGTGKELVAREIHDNSARHAGPFMAINCAAISPALIESELFGHVKGAFTDAKNARSGLFVEATGGTLFIDEIGELPLDMQPKLLRALQERRVRPVGSNTEVPFDVRLVAATNRDLELEVDAKRFREDLYYRVNVVTLTLPPLRERSGDVLALANHFLEKAARRSGAAPVTLPSEIVLRLVNYPWPGNVRELENCVERMLALSSTGEIATVDLPESIRDYRAERFAVQVEDASVLVPMDEVEKQYIQRALTLFGGNKTRTAQVLGLDRRTLYRKAERWGMK